MTPTRDLLGKTLGQYELREVISAGAMVATYLGYQPTLEREVIVQTLSPAHRTATDWQQGFTHGARIIAALEHPNIVPILDHGKDDGIDYIVMRHLHGPTLWKRLQDGPLPPTDAANAISQIGSALDYVHSLGEVHGDPAVVNIVFDAWGSAYISDFLLNGLLQHLATDGISGVPAYMAPERWQGEPSTPATDQYALAAIAYEMLSGHTPMIAKEMVPLMMQHLNDMVPPIDLPMVPDAVNPVLSRALAKEPTQRYPTVTNFTQEFNQALNAQAGHLFISYSRRDTDYAQQLKDDLRENGLPVWIDDQIEHGSQWFNEINAAIETCTAFVVIMSPDAEASEWVQKEILLAKRYEKPIFPVLLRGQEFPLLIDIQFADVRDETLPGTPFYRRLNRVVFGQT